MAESDQQPSEELLSAALRELARSSPHSASDATRARVTQQFHRHRSRQKATRIVGIAVVAVVVIGGTLGVRTLFIHNHRLLQGTAPMSIAPPDVAVKAPDRGVSQQVRGGKNIKGTLHPTASEMQASFLALPSYALATPGEDLRVVRVEMPLSSLRMLGARVNDEFATGTVVADLLVGPDGTPYAFRLVT
jgi:hypothetical protein